MAQEWSQTRPFARVRSDLAFPLSDRITAIGKFLAAPHKWVNFLFRHPTVTFVLMGAFFLAFGVTSVNLFVLLKMNLDLFLEYGLMVIDDGALQQLVELLGSAYLSMLFYVMWRLCERIIVERLIRARLRGAAKADGLPSESKGTVASD